MSAVLRPLYRFVPTQRIEVETPRGRLYLFNLPGGAGRSSLGAEDYEVACLFNGKRTEEEIRDVVLNTRGRAMSAENLQAFIDKLLDVGLLEPVQLPVPVSARRHAVGGERSGRGRPGPAAAAIPRRRDAEADGGEPPRRLRSLHGAGPRAYVPDEADYDAGDEEVLDVEYTEADPPYPRPAVAAGGGGGRAPAPPEGYAGGAFGADRLRPRRRAAGAERPQRGVRFLLRFPVTALLPLARPLGWASWSPYLALLLAGIMAGLGVGLWQARIELQRDLAAWFVPLTIVQTFALGLVLINLWAQLARAAEYARQLGEPPPFGITLAWRILPVFAADLSGLARARDLKAARRVFAASLSAVATICALTFFAWFLTKNNGTTLPLIFVGLAALATIRLVLNLNPLGRRDGYHLMALRLGVPDLRRRAFATLFGLLRGDLPLPPGRTRPVPRWALALYGLAAAAYVAAVFVVVTIFIGGWLEANWGGFGVLVFLVALALVLYDPVRDWRARRAERAARLRPTRTLGQRAWSMTKLALFFAVVAGLGMIPYQYEPGGDFVLRALQTNRTDVRSLISGRVEAVLVSEGEFVRENQVLARVSGEEERKNVESTAANIRELEAQLAKARAGATPEAVAVARQRVSAAKTRYDFSKSKADRYTQLRESGFVSAQDYENVRGQAEIDREALLQAEKELAQLLAGTRREEIDALRAAIDQQKANLAYHTQQLQYTEIRAPISGHIVSGSLLTAAGNYLKNGDLFATIEDTSSLLAEIQVPQFDISLVQPGAPIRLKAWTRPDLEIRGTVQSVAPSAEETPAGKVVRVTSFLDNRDGALKSGMTGYAKIGGEEMPAALAFTRLIQRFVQIEFWSWLP